MTKIFGLDKNARGRRTLHTRTHTGKLCQVIFSAILILGAIGSVNAEPTNTSNSFPLDELMQPDYRYLNSAIYPNTGVYDGDVMVNALYDWDLFSPTAGNYLPANSTTITQCTAGNFCTGATNIHYDADNNQGITACSTLGDNSYTQSAVGSDEETDCYRNCSGNVTIEHATTITGNDYYGAGTDTCSATACEGGYHTDNNACGANVLTITWANSENPNTTCTYGGSITTPATAPTIPGKTFVGWAFFTPIEYMEGTGTQWIDTGYIPDNNTGVKTKVQLNSVENTEAIVFGSGQNYNSRAFELYIWDRQLEFNYGVRPVYSSQHIKINDIIELDWNRNNVSYKLNDNDVESFSMLAQNFSTPYSMYIFSLHRPTQIDNGKIKVYYFKIYDNNTLVRDFIPVKDANGVACMYDRVGKRFYYNAGTGNFIAGPNL